MINRDEKRHNWVLPGQKHRQQQFDTLQSAVVLASEALHLRPHGPDATTEANRAAATLESAPLGLNLWRDALRRFARNRAAMVSAVLLCALILACVIGPWVWPFSAIDSDWNAMQTPPSWASGHWFGTDDSGRDLMARMLLGGRVSLMVGLFATLASCTLGIFWGAVAGYVGGRVDAAMMAVVDVMYAIPYLLIAILLITLLGRDFTIVVLAITVFSWMTMARIVRAQTMWLRQSLFIEAARAMGLSSLSIIVRHILPNLLGVVLIYTTITVPGVMLTESVLSFLGLGVQEPMTSWGVLIAEGMNVMEDASWLMIFPAVFLSATLYCFNFIGDGLRDALDPTEQRY